MFVLTLLAPQVSHDQSGFAGLGQDIAGFAQPQKDMPWSFPKDHGGHPDYRIEWWYVTANLKDDKGRDYGVQWTLFRSALRPETTIGWNDPQIWMGHAALTTASQHFTSERFARGGIGVAGAVASPFETWIDEWALRGNSDFSQLSLNGGGTDFAYDLTLATNRPLIFHGDNGYSVKSEGGQASRYYSQPQPHFKVTGDLVFSDRQVSVSGTAWLDREYSSQPLAPDQQGWDWFSIHLDDGAKVMLFRLRGADNFYSGTWIAPDGQTTSLDSSEIVLSTQRTAKVAGRSIPLDWDLKLPNKNVDITIQPLNDQAWMDGRFSYWEGPILVNGTHSGRGYLEMTGYE